MKKRSKCNQNIKMAESRKTMSPDSAMSNKKKGVIEEWAERLTVPQAQEILDRYEYADMQCLLHGPSDEWEVDASHAASRGPALRKRIERGALI